MRTTNNLRRLVTALAPCCALLAAVCPARADGAGVDGQALLRANHNASARAAFVAALHRNPADTSARRGLGWLAEQEDDPTGALQAWRPLYHLAPGHWSATALWPEMVQLTEETGRWDILTGAARDIMASPDAPSSLKASARLALAHQALRQGNTTDADRLWAGLGYLRAWHMIGPFDNVSKSGFDAAWPPEQGMDLHHSCPGKDGQVLQWHPLALVGRNGACAIGQSLGDGESDVFYATTSVYAPHDQPVTLQFSTAGASKLFVNGRLIFADALYRPDPDLVADVFPVPVTLHRGWNTVLVKLADDDSVTASFALRVTTPKGADLSTLADPTRIVLTASGPTDTPAGPVETATATLLRRQGIGDPEATDALVSELRASGDDAGATDVARANLARDPNSAWLHWQLSQTLQSDGQVDEARVERDAARQANPRLLPAALDALDEQSTALASGEYVDQLKTLLAINPHSPSVLWDLAEAYDTVKLTGEALRTARLAEQAAPGTASVLHLARYLEAHDRKPEAQHVLGQALAEAPNDPDLLDRRAGQLSDQGDTAAAIAVYQRLLLQELPDPTDRTALAELYQSRQNLPAAAKMLSIARQERPQNSDICARLAEVVRGLGSKKEALSLLSVAISLDPSAVALREERQILQGEKPVIDLAPATAGQPLIDQARTHGAQEASAVFLLDEGREVVYPDYATVCRYHQIIKIGDAAAAQRFGSYSLSRPTASARVTLESARLVKSDGKVQDMTDQTDDDDPSTVSFPALAPGDTIDVAYRVEDYARGGLAHQFWSNWQFSVDGVPVKLSRFVLITPAGMSFQSQMHGAGPSPSVHDVAGWNVHEWRTVDVPPFKRQALGAPITDGGSWLDISTVNSWADVVHWYRALSGPRCVPDEAIRAKALDLTKDAHTETDKLRAIVAYVRSIPYQSTPFRLSAYVPTEGKQVLREQYGDCKDKAALLTSLLSAVGIKSDMVLLSPRSHGLTPYLPSPRFNHAIARVQTAQGPLWVDATADEMAFGDFPYDDQQTPALVINDATMDLTTTPLLPTDRNHLDDEFHGTLSADGALHGGLVITGDGNWGWIFHSIFKEIPQDKQDEALRSMTGGMTKDAVYDSGGIDNAVDPDRPITLRMNYHLDGYSAAADNFLLLRLPWENGEQGQALEALQAQAPQGQGMDLALLRGQYVSKLQLQIPTGFAPQNLPAEDKVDSPFGSYRMTYKMNGDTLTAERDLTMTAAHISAEDVPRLMTFLHGLDQETEKQLVFKKS